MEPVEESEQVDRRLAEAVCIVLNSALEEIRDKYAKEVKTEDAR